MVDILFLPVERQLDIMIYLGNSDLRSLLNLCSTSQQFNAISNDEHLWFELCKNEIDQDLEFNNPIETSWKQTYRKGSLILLDADEIYTRIVHVIIIIRKELGLISQLPFVNESNKTMFDYDLIYQTVVDYLLSNDQIKEINGVFYITSELIDFVLPFTHFSNPIVESLYGSIDYDYYDLNDDQIVALDDVIVELVNEDIINCRNVLKLASTMDDFINESEDYYVIEF